jgi:hypothetical protein
MAELKLCSPSESDSQFIGWPSQNGWVAERQDVPPFAGNSKKLVQIYL